MYVTMTRVRTGEHPIEYAGIFAEEMLGWLRDMPGFEGVLMLSREGLSIGLTFWESQEAAERQDAVRQQFVERLTSTVGVELEDRTNFQLTFAQLGPLTGPS